MMIMLLMMMDADVEDCKVIAMMLRMLLMMMVDFNANVPKDNAQGGLQAITIQ